MNFITFHGGPLDVVNLPKTINIFCADGIDTMDKQDQRESNVKIASYHLFQDNPPAYRYNPKIAAKNGIVPQ